MRAFTRILAAVTIAIFSAGPTCAAAAQKLPTFLAQAANTATIQGVVVDDTGVPVAGVKVQLTGPATYSGTTDSTGAFSITGVAQGVYVLAASKAGYQTASEGNFAVIAGQSENVQIALRRRTFSSLRTIATVSASAQQQFNTSPASVNVVPAQTFVDQAQPQVNRILNQIPGVQNSYPVASANAATAGSNTNVTIRGGASYETTALIDGHPLATGQYGDYVTTFLSSYLFGSIEVVKGPGADAPVVNGAIGGTINFRTADPTLAPTPTALFGFTSHGGSFSAFGVSDTIMNDKLGFVVRVATEDDPSPLNGYGAYFDPSYAYPGGNPTPNPYAYLTSNSGYGTVPGTSTSYTNATSMLACCYPVTGYYNTVGELIKARYKVSSATTATVSYLGGQSWSDNNGNTGNITYQTFDPSLATPASGQPAYSGSLVPGRLYPVDYIFAGGTDALTNNEPIFQGEVSSTVGNDTVLARYYHALVNRDLIEGTLPNALGFNNVDINGIDGYTGTVYSNYSTLLGVQNFYQEIEDDRLSGLSFQYLHPIGDRDDISFSVDSNNKQSTDYEAESPYGAPGPTGTPSYIVKVPTGSGQVFTTYLLRAHLYFGNNWTLTLADYYNTYANTFATSCPQNSYGTFECNYDGSNVGFTTTNSSHNDPRVGLVYRPTRDLAIRAAAGSSIAPPYLYLLSGITQGTINYTPGNPYATTTIADPNLKPETAFGYDIGADWRTPNGYLLVSTDLYSTNLFNHFFEQTVNSGLTCTLTLCPGVPVGLPLYSQTTINLSSARYQGWELLIRHAPPVGFGFSVGGALQHAYAYNLPPGFYCTLPNTTLAKCPADDQQNLNVIEGENFNAGSDAADGASSIVGQNIPYLQGDANVSYTTRNGVYALLGETFYGKNNSLFQPPFGIGYASLRVPINDRIALQVSGDNIFNALNGLIPNYVGGVPIDLANGTKGATTGNVLGPANYRFMFITRF